MADLCSNSLTPQGQGIHPYKTTVAMLWLTSDFAQFLVNISVGEPPIPQLLHMDTGSNLLWFQCLPCTNCFKQLPPLFDPSKSSTYKALPRTSPSCVAFPEDKCNVFNECKFSISYFDGSTAKGLIATEKLTFTTSDEGTASILDVVVGRGHINHGTYGQSSGVLGLGPESIYLVTKLGSKFSYCIGSIRDAQYSYNQLILGNDVILQGSNTPLEIYRRSYYLTMEGIRVGEKQLNIDPGAFTRTASGEGGVIIDSGSTLTTLVEAAYAALSAEVISLLQGKLERVNDPTLLCYKGDISRDLTDFPVVTFEFAGGVELALDVLSFFVENEPGMFCMAVDKSQGDYKFNMIGVMAQQHYNVGYDLLGKRITSQRIDCQLLEISIL